MQEPDNLRKGWQIFTLPFFTLYVYLMAAKPFPAFSIDYNHAIIF